MVVDFSGWFERWLTSISFFFWGAAKDGNFPHLGYLSGISQVATVLNPGIFRQSIGINTSLVEDVKHVKMWIWKIYSSPKDEL